MSLPLDDLSWICVPHKYIDQMMATPCPECQKLKGEEE